MTDISVTDTTPELPRSSSGAPLGYLEIGRDGWTCKQCGACVVRGGDAVRIHDRWHQKQIDAEQRLKYS